MNTSTGLTEDARTRTRSWPSPGTGGGEIVAQGRLLPEAVEGERAHLDEFGRVGWSTDR